MDQTRRVLRADDGVDISYVVIPGSEPAVVILLVEPEVDASSCLRLVPYPAERSYSSTNGVMAGARGYPLTLRAQHSLGMLCRSWIAKHPARSIWSGTRWVLTPQCSRPWRAPISSGPSFSSNVVKGAAMIKSMHLLANTSAPGRCHSLTVPRRQSSWGTVPYTVHGSRIWSTGKMDCIPVLILR